MCEVHKAGSGTLLSVQHEVRAEETSSALPLQAIIRQAEPLCKDCLSESLMTKVRGHLRSCAA